MSKARGPYRVDPLGYKKKAMQQALEVMRNQGDVSVDEWIAAEKALQEALAEQPAQQKPLFWFDPSESFSVLRSAVFDTVPQSQRKGWKPLYTSPPAQRTWVGLTYEEAKEIYTCIHGYDSSKRIANAIEAKLKEKNA